MAIKLCHHIKADGIWCKSAALHGRDYCYAHLTFRGRRVRSARQARKNAWRLELPLLEDLNSVQVAVMQVLDALTENRITHRDTGQLLYGLQNAANNLRGKDHASFEVKPEAENRCVAYDSFEEDFELVDEEPATGEKLDTSGAEAASAQAEEVAGKKEAAPEHTEEEAPSPIVLDKLMAVADDEPADSPAGADLPLPEPRETAKKQPRGLRPPNAVRQSPEEATALAKEQQGSAPECGRLDDGEIVPCKTCEVHVFKRLAQFWERRNNGDEWLPYTGTIDCLDCQLKHLTTLGKHLDDTMPFMFDLYMVLKDDGGEDPGTFDDYFWKSKAHIEQTSHIPEDWRERYGRYRERSYAPLEGEAEGGEEEASA